MRALLVAAAIATLAGSSQASDMLPSYKIVAEEKTEASRTVDVRIDRRIEETDVTAIANAIVNREPKPFNRTVVNFVLPLAKPGEPPWASATLVRDLRVKIPGLRLDEERQFIGEARADKREVIGHWLTSTPATPGRITIFRESKRLYAEWRMRSGVRTQDEVTETRTSSGRRFDLKQAANDDHFVMTPGGDLEIRSKGQMIALGERIKDGPVVAPAIAGSRDRNTVVASWPPVSTIEPIKAEPALSDSDGRAQGAAAVADPSKQAKSAKAPPQRRQATQQQGGASKVDLTRFLQPQT
jgi:hypothetical protein